MPQAFASIKIRREFLSWVKQKAAIRGCLLYEMLEELAARAVGGTPWTGEIPGSPPPPARRASAPARRVAARRAGT